MAHDAHTDERLLRWGILGTARINRHVIPAMRQAGRCRLVAVASRWEDRAAAYADAWRIPRAHGSYEALLADPEVDVVYNPLPNGLHADWTIRACAAGKHVLCEKPLALTVEDVDSMAAAAARHARVVTEAFMYRHHPQMARLQALVDGGAIGTLGLIRASFTFPLADRTNVRYDRALGGGSLWDVGCYPVSFARAVTRLEPVEVFGWSRQTSGDVDEWFAGQLRFATGVLAQFDSGFQAPFRTAAELVGDRGVIRLERPFKPDVTGHIEVCVNDEVVSHESAPQAAYVGEIEDLTSAVLDGTTPALPLADSRHNVATILALLESARSGRAVQLP